MKRANPFPDNKTAAIIPILSLRPVKPIRLKAAHYRVLLLALLCFLLPGYISNVNWNDCATTINERYLVVPVFIESTSTMCERQVTKIFGHMLNIGAGEITAEENKIVKKNK